MLLPLRLKFLSLRILIHVDQNQITTHRALASLFLLHLLQFLHSANRHLENRVYSAVRILGNLEYLAHQEDLGWHLLEYRVHWARRVHLAYENYYYYSDCSRYGWLNCELHCCYRYNGFYLNIYSY